MDGSGIWNIVGGLVAYVLGVVLCVLPVLFGNFMWLKSRWTRDIDEEDLLKQGHRSLAIHLGSLFVCQALLVRHAVNAVTQVVRNLFIYRYPFKDALWLLGLCCLFVLLITSLALISVRIAEWSFKRLTGKLKEDEEIKRDNVAVAIFSALVILAITLILNEGVEDFAQSLVPLGRTAWPG